MPTRSRRLRDAAGRPPTANDLARREQITNAAIEIVGRAGWRACTLQAVADRLDLTKAAILYHVGTKDELVRRAYDAVIARFTSYVERRVEVAADPREAIVAFGAAHLTYMREHRDDARVIAEALNPGHSTGIQDTPQDARRAAPLIGMIEAARGVTTPSRSGSFDPVIVATAIAGMIDSAVAAWLEDPDFDLAASEDLLTTFIKGAI